MTLEHLSKLAIFRRSVVGAVLKSSCTLKYTPVFARSASLLQQKLSAFLEVLTNGF